MAEEGGPQFNGVARLEARFAEEPGGKFQRGDVACVHVDANLGVFTVVGNAVLRMSRPSCA